MNTKSRFNISLQYHEASWVSIIKSKWQLSVKKTLFDQNIRELRWVGLQPHITAANFHTPNSGESDVIRLNNVNSPRAVDEESVKFPKIRVTLKANSKNVLFLSPNEFHMRISAWVIAFQRCNFYCRQICRRVRIQQSLRPYNFQKKNEALFRVKINPYILIIF